MKKLALIGTFCHNQEQLDTLKDTILEWKKLNVDTLVLSPLHLPEDIIKLFSGDTNSDNTTATEERALMAAYQLIIVPAMVYAMSNPNFLSVLGPLAGPTAGAMAMLGTSHTVKKAVSSKTIQLLYGSKGYMSRRKNIQRKPRNSR
jgi:hypothetical protein